MDPFKDADPTETFTRQYGETAPIELLGYRSDSDEIWRSTGLTLWRASDRLCEYLVEQQRCDGGLLRCGGGLRILELGAGLGLVGILAHRLTAGRGVAATVCLTDGDTDALACMRENVRRNCPDDTSGTGRGNPRISCRQLLWGRSAAEAFLHEQPRQEKFDIILAADVIYAPSIVEPLWETVRTLLKPDRPGPSSTPPPCFVLAFARRRVPVKLAEVLEAAARAGFIVAHQDPVATPVTEEEDHSVEETGGVRILVFRWDHGPPSGC